MEEDVYFTPATSGEGRHTVKMSRFLSFAVPVRTAEEAKAALKELQARYRDCRHICWAYSLGPKGEEWQLNDNGEPSGTAGRPILGQIHSFGLTDVIVMVARYFGGIKLGTPGLIAAYKESARLALESAGRREIHEMFRLSVEFPYAAADKVMKVAKGEGVEIVTQKFDNLCRLEILVRKSMLAEVQGRLSSVEGTVVDSL